jgi:hypothetical protein
MYSRATGSVLSQMATSATNFLVTLVVARGGNLAEFGTFSLVFLTIATLIQFLRTSLGQGLLLGGRHEAGAYLRAQTGFGFVGSVLAGVTATLLYGDVWVGVVTYIAAHLAFIQDGLRYTQAQSGAWMRAAISDLTMLVVVIVGATIAIAAELTDAIFMLSSWGLGALAGVLVLIPWMPTWRGVSGIKWVRGATATLMPLAAESGILLSFVYISNWLVAGLASVAVLGVYRAVLVCMNPINSLAMAMLMLVLSPNGIGGQRMQSGRRGAYCVFAVFAGVLVLAVGLWTGLLYLGGGAFLFGEVWVAVAPVCVFVAAGQALAMVGLVGDAIIKRLLGPIWTLRLSLSVSWTQPVLIGIATVTIPVIGPMVGWVASQAIVCAATALTMTRAIARRFMHATR